MNTETKDVAQGSDDEQYTVGMRDISLPAIFWLSLLMLAFLAVHMTLYYSPRPTIVEPAGVVKSIMPSGEGGSVLVTDSRRYLVRGTWPTLEGVAVETRRTDGELYGVSLPRFLYETPAPSLCVVGADICSTILN